MAHDERSEGALPGDLQTEPNTKIVFNAPFLITQKCQLRLSNNSESRIGWVLKSTNVRRFLVSPTCGALDAGEQVVLDISCQSFNYEEKPPPLHERVTVEWMDAPSPSAEFSRQWFSSSGVVRRKMMPIEYNL